MNERIAKALVEDIILNNRRAGELNFQDGEKIYTVSVTVKREVQKSFHDSASRLIEVSAGSAGSACGCCGGTGRG